VTDPGRLEALILDLCRQAGTAKTICPTVAAHAAAKLGGGDDLAWRGLVSNVRRAAIALALQGRLIIYRKGRPVDPADFCGVYRLGLPRSD
jgi:hypothetical protein